MSSTLTFKKHTLAAITAVCLLLFVAILIPHPVWNILLITLGGATLLSFVWVKLLQRSLMARRFLQANWIAIGDVLVEQFEIENKGWLPATWIEIRDSSNVPGYRPSFVVSLGWRRTEKWRQASVCTRRGRYRLGPWSLRMGDPFGLFEAVFTFPEHNEIVIHPPILDRLPVPLPAGNSDGNIPRRQQVWQAQSHAAVVRPFQPDDPPKRIHWPTSARRNELFVRQFEQDAAGDVWLLLDLDADVQLGQGRDGTEETAVLLAAALAAQALQQRRAVGLIAYGQEPQIVVPSRGKNQSWRLLEALAVASTARGVTLARSLQDATRVIRRQAAVLIITPRHSATWLPALLRLKNRGIFVSVALLDRQSFGGQSMKSSQQSIQKLGIRCDIVPRTALIKGKQVWRGSR